MDSGSLMGKIKKEACHTIYYRRLRLLWDQLKLLSWNIENLIRIEKSIEKEKIQKEIKSIKSSQTTSPRP